MRIIFFLTVLGGLGLLTLAIWPGVLVDTLFDFGLLCLAPLLLLGWFVLLVTLALGELARLRERPRRPAWGLRSAAVMFLTLALLWIHVPERIALGLYHQEFRQLVDEAPGEAFAAKESRRQVGPYQIDRYAADPRGGVFFRTHAGPDGFGPDEMSYGFAFQPNDEGTPFGRAKYRKRHLFGDWYTFAASNDW